MQAFALAGKCGGLGERIPARASSLPSIAESATLPSPALVRKRNSRRVLLKDINELVRIEQHQQRVGHGPSFGRNLRRLDVLLVPHRLGLLRQVEFLTRQLMHQAADLRQSWTRLGKLDF